MTLKKYPGSCHCGAVRFEAELDLSEGLCKCNCSICTKARAWFVIVPPERVHFLAGLDQHSEYTWVPPGRSRSNLRYRFCKTCGVRTVGRGDHGRKGEPFCFVNVAALDVSRSELSVAPTRYLDGRNGRPQPEARE